MTMSNRPQLTIMTNMPSQFNTMPIVEVLGPNDMSSPEPMQFSNIDNIDNIDEGYSSYMSSPEDISNSHSAIYDSDDDRSDDDTVIVTNDNEDDDIIIHTPISSQQDFIRELTSLYTTDTHHRQPDCTVYSGRFNKTIGNDNKNASNRLPYSKAFLNILNEKTHKNYEGKIPRSNRRHLPYSKSFLQSRKEKNDNDEKSKAFLIKRKLLQASGVFLRARGGEIIPQPIRRDLHHDFAICYGPDSRDAYYEHIEFQSAEFRSNLDNCPTIEAQCTNLRQQWAEAIKADEELKEATASPTLNEKESRAFRAAALMQHLNDNNKQKRAKEQLKNETEEEEEACSEEKEKTNENWREDWEDYVETHDADSNGYNGDEEESSDSYNDDSSNRSNDSDTTNYYDAMSTGHDTTSTDSDAISRLYASDPEWDTSIGAASTTSSNDNDDYHHYSNNYYEYDSNTDSWALISDVSDGTALSGENNEDEAVNSYLGFDQAL